MPLPNSRAVDPRLHQELRGSALGELGMPDECTITRPTAGEGSIDPGTGQWTPPAGVTVFTGACRVQPDTRARPTVVDTLDVSRHLRRYRASIPWDAPQVLVDDVLTVTRTHDPQLAGRPLLVRDVKYDTFQVRRFIDLEDHPNLATPEGP